MEPLPRYVDIDYAKYAPDLPEAQREARGALRDAILALGGAPVQGGLYASAHAWEASLRDIADFARSLVAVRDSFPSPSRIMK